MHAKPDLRVLFLLARFPFRLGDHCRYRAQENLMRRIQLSPVRENESENHRGYWRRRGQILGSVLHWAHDAGANRIEFDPRWTEPFRYLTPSGDRVTTELGDTPSEYVNSIAQFIRDTIDGHPFLRPFRRLVRAIIRAPVSAQIEIPPTSVYSGSVWCCTMNDDNALFTKMSDTAPTGNAG